MDIYVYRIIVQYQQFGTVASKPKTEHSYRYEVTSSCGKQLTTPKILGFLERGDSIVCNQGFLVRGGGQRTSNRARTMVDESAVLTRLKRFEIVEKTFRLTLQSLPYVDCGMVVKAISVFEKIPLAYQTKSLKSLQPLHK